MSSTGGITETIEDRRNKGWGKVSTIMGILEEVTLGSHRLEVNSLLFSTEAWSGVTEKHLKHSKCGVEFHHLETKPSRSFILNRKRIKQKGIGFNFCIKTSNLLKLK